MGINGRGKNTESRIERLYCTSETCLHEIWRFSSHRFHFVVGCKRAFSQSQVSQPLCSPFALFFPIWMLLLFHYSTPAKDHSSWRIMMTLNVRWLTWSSTFLISAFSGIFTIRFSFGSKQWQLATTRSYGHERIDWEKHKIRRIHLM